MNTMMRLLTLATIAAVSIPARAQIAVVVQDFNTLAPSDYMKPTGPAGVALGSGPEAITLITTAGAALRIVDVGSENRVLRFVSAASSGGPLAVTGFSGTSTNGMGNNAIVGSFDFRSLTVTNGGYQSFVFGINTGTHSPGPTASALIYFNHGIDVTYYDGTAGRQTPTAITIGRDVNYRLSLLADYSEIGAEAHDNYSFIITNLDASVIVYKSPKIATRSRANLLPDRIFFYGGASNGSGSASDPYFQIDNLYFHAMNIAMVPGLIGWPGQDAAGSTK